jgi:hypothetical protein
MPVLNTSADVIVAESGVDGRGLTFPPHPTNKRDSKARMRFFMNAEVYSRVAGLASKKCYPGIGEIPLYSFISLVVKGFSFPDPRPSA